MKINFLVTLFILLTVILPLLNCTSATSNDNQQMKQQAIIELPDPTTKGKISIEETLFERRSIRDYSTAPLYIEEISQLLWATQGKTAGWGGRTAPSAGALYPLEVYIVAGKVDKFLPGIYKYGPQEHRLLKLKEGDFREQLSAASLSQTSIKQAPASIIITAVYERTTGKYGERGIRYVHMEAGHAAQNLCLQATALNLGAVTIGAFQDNETKQIIGLAGNEFPLYVIPVGRNK